jgi:hypothetical protein
VRGWLIILGKPLNKTDLKLHMVISSFSRPKMPIRLGPILYPWTTSVVQLPPQLNFHPPYRCFFFRSDDGLYCPFSSTLQNLRDGESQLGKDCGGKITSTWIDIHAFRCSWTYGRTSINIYIISTYERRLLFGRFRDWKWFSEIWFLQADPYVCRLSGKELFFSMLTT